MKVVHIATDDLTGGAAIAAYRLNEAMNQNNIDSKMLVALKTSKSLNVVSFFKRLKELWFRLISGILSVCNGRILQTSYDFSLGIGCAYLASDSLVKEVDLIYVHWVGKGFLGIKQIEKLLKTGKPIVMFMHDMWDITGGCHHSFGCNQYQSRCQMCPIIQNSCFKGLVSKVYKQKEKKLKPYSNLCFATPSNWLGDCVKKSALFNSHNIMVIPNIIDTTKFKPFNKEFAREILGLPQDKKLLLFGANGGKNNPSKGWNYLKEALSYLKRDDIEIVFFGGELSEDEKQELGLFSHSLGYIVDAYSLALMYNAVDTFVIPSLAENFPNTILESLSCGTLVVGFNVGGIPDLIRHKQTGYLAKYKDAKDLVVGIDWAIEHMDREIALTLHSFVQENFSYDKGVKMHIDYWNNIMTRS